MKSDMQIQKDVMDQLKWEPVLNAAEIGVAVKDGIVTLSGIVDSYAKKIAAETASKKVSGVRGVAEDIQVGMSPMFRKTDTEIVQAVLNALKWDSLVPDERIKVKVEDGVVTLEGEVQWEYQRNAAKTDVENLTGVLRINNFITIKPVVTAANVKQKIVAAFTRAASIDADKIKVQVSGSNVTLTGKTRSVTEMDEAIHAAWSAPGVSVVDNRLVVEEEEYAY
jgi:osmotically-inducible protein OsmY